MEDWSRPQDAKECLAGLLAQRRPAFETQNKRPVSPVRFRHTTITQANYRVLQQVQVPLSVVMPSESRAEMLIHRLEISKCARMSVIVLELELGKVVNINHLQTLPKCIEHQAHSKLSEIEH